MLNKTLENKRVIYSLLLLTGIPHLFHLPLLLNLYLLLFFIYVYLNDEFNHLFNKKIALTFFIIIGLIFGLFEYIKYFNLNQLIRAKVFIELVTSLLIFLITIQFIINYKSDIVKISPIFLLITSLFFYKNIYYLIYTIVILFLTVTLIIVANTSLDIKKSFRYTASIFISSLPFVIIIFLIFPRVAYQKRNFGFRELSYRVSGFGESIDIGDGEELLQSNQIVMEVGFIDKIPKENQLYFRGAVLYNYDGKKHWSKITQLNLLPRREEDNKSLISYKITLYPTYKNILFTIDIPTTKIKIYDTYFDKDLILKNGKPIKDIKRYQLVSALKYKILDLDENTKRYSLVTLPNINPKTKALALEIVKKSKNDEEKLLNIIDFLKKSNLKYTLKPKKLTSKDKIDELLFKTKEGFCVHFATAFAILARETGLPTRVVTGYKGDYKERVNNYIIIRERNAHAWNEVYIKKRGWVRIDPTIFTTQKEGEVINSGGVKREITQFDKLKAKLYLYMMYIKYKIDDWILNYDYLKQLRILNNIKQDKTILLYIFLSFIALIIISYIIYNYLLYSKEEDKILKEYRKILYKLEKRGYKKEYFEGATTFLKRVNKRLNSKELEKITNLYIELRYKNRFTKEEFLKFKKMIREFKV